MADILYRRPQYPRPALGYNQLPLPARKGGSGGARQKEEDPEMQELIKDRMRVETEAIRRSGGSGGGGGDKGGGNGGGSGGGGGKSGSSSSAGGGAMKEAAQVLDYETKTIEQSTAGLVKPSDLTMSMNPKAAQEYNARYNQLAREAITREFQAGNLPLSSLMKYNPEAAAAIQQQEEDQKRQEAKYQSALDIINQDYSEGKIGKGERDSALSQLMEKQYGGTVLSEDGKKFREQNPGWNEDIGKWFETAWNEANPPAGNQQSAQPQVSSQSQVQKPQPKEVPATQSLGGKALGSAFGSIPSIFNSSGGEAASAQSNQGRSLLMGGSDVEAQQSAQQPAQQQLASITKVVETLKAAGLDEETAIKVSLQILTGATPLKSLSGNESLPSIVKPTYDTRIGPISE